MPFRRRKASLALFSIVALTFSACQPTVTSPGSTMPPAPTPSASPSTPAPSPVPGASSAPVTPTPVVSSPSGVPGPTANPNSGSTTTVTLPDGTRLVIALPNRFLSSKGQSVQLSVRLLDPSGKELPLGSVQLLFSSSRPADFSISDTGVVTALKDSGFSNLTVQVVGTEIVATQLISVDAFVGSGGGGGGGGSVSSPSASAAPPTQVNANVNFEGLSLGEFQVNTYTTSDQIIPAMAMDADGDFVVTWQSDGQDGNSFGIYAQRYNTAGVAQGSEFRVNTYTTNGQSRPSVAMDADGDFVVTWNSYGQDSLYSYGVYGQRYNASGVAQGSEFRVNTYTTSSQRNPSVAMDADGDFVVTWQSDQDGSPSSVYGQRYNALGVAQGSEFRVNTYTTSTQFNAAVAMNADGDFVVTWQSFGQDGSSSSVYGQRYNTGGVAQGSEFRVNTYTTNRQINPAVAMDTDGDFVVTWESYGQDGSDRGIYAQRYNASGVAQGSEFRINTYTSNQQRNASIAMDADGDFVVTWQSDGQDGGGDGIYGQRYNAAGVAQGSEFRVNTYTTNNQTQPSVAMDADGDFVVTWNSSGQEGDNYEGIRAKRYGTNGMAK